MVEQGVPTMGEMPQIKAGFKWSELASSLEERAITADQRAQVGMESQRRYEADIKRKTPYFEAGRTALGKLQDLVYGRTKITEDPGYQFRLEQGQLAAERSQAARRKLFSGQAGKELQRFGQGLAAQEYQNAVGRLANIAYAPNPIQWSPQTVNAAPNMTGGDALRAAAADARKLPPAGAYGGGEAPAPAPAAAYVSPFTDEAWRRGAALGVNIHELDPNDPAYRPGAAEQWGAVADQMGDVFAPGGSFATTYR